MTQSWSPMPRTRAANPAVPLRASPRSRKLRIVFGIAAGLLLAKSLVRIVERVREPADKRTSRLIHRASGDPELIYELVPGASGVRDGVSILINEAGFRDDPFLKDGEPAGGRIVVLGDSVAWGWGVEMPDAFPQVLERRLNENRADGEPPVVVFNLTVDGYSTTQEARLLETRVAVYRPDLVIVAYVLNDPDEADGGLARHFTASPSALLELLRRSWSKATDPAPPPFDGLDWSREYHFFVHARHKAEVERNFARLGRWSGKHGVPVLVAVVPLMLFEPGVPYPWQYLHDYVGSLCHREGLDFLDLYPAFSGRSADGLKFDEWHPNTEGHGIIAEALAERIRAILRTTQGARAPRPSGHEDSAAP